MVNSSRQSFTDPLNSRLTFLLALLTLSWIVLFLGIRLASWDLMPYEAIPLEKRPSIGWERTLNDFLEQSPTLPLMSGGLTLLSVLLFRYGWMKPQVNKVNLIKTFGLSNVLSVVLLVLAIPLVAFLPVPFTPPGYGFALKFILKDVLILGGLFVYQFRKSLTS